MKLWEKNKATKNEVIDFTVGNDRNFDLLLAPYDVLGSIAHVMMLESVGLLTKREKEDLVKELRNIYSQIAANHFSIDLNMEDIHSQIEYLLTVALGDTGKKIHTARSRNDQVLLDLKLFLRNELEVLVHSAVRFFNFLQQLSEKYKEYLLPGYTHLQPAMPSSFGLWFGAYAESLADDLIVIRSAYDIVNKNPLGSAAGFGSSFPIDRSMTTRLLGFETLHYNSVYAQMSRGKTERIVAQALAAVADTLARLSYDVCLYVNPDFGFISFPEELTTGSSIMPHKKNPDVFELIRSYCNRIKALPNEITLMTSNLPSGYHRDFQLLKEHLFPAFQSLNQCLHMAEQMLSEIEVRKDILNDEKYRYLFSVEVVNQLVKEGVPFRDAYKKVGEDIASGRFIYNKKLTHTHEGSIGQLCNEEIRKSMQQVFASFPFEKVRNALQALVQD
ncbi:MAG: argininosuccinate lyase [Chitinophagaceae bacterium]|nr:argininosuccinate lyase [Chitinophagaceae bacterium]